MTAKTGFGRVADRFNSPDLNGSEKNRKGLINISTLKLAVAMEDLIQDHEFKALIMAKIFEIRALAYQTIIDQKEKSNGEGK